MLGKTVNLKYREHCKEQDYVSRMKNFQQPVSVYSIGIRCLLLKWARRLKLSLVAYGQT